MNGANHALKGFSTYPFKVFGGKWSKASLDIQSKGDTIIGNDVWIGNNATFMPGVKIGDGAVIGAHSLVTKDVEPYTTVGGNPAKEIRKRFNDETIKILLNLKWWDWDLQKITDHLDVITKGTQGALKEIYKGKR